MSEKNSLSNNPSWFLDEIASAGRENLDAEHATRYDNKEDAEAIHELNLLKKFDLNHQSVVVDIGAGTGQFAVAAATICDQVIAVDVSPIMLDVLHAKVERSGLSNVKVVQSGFLTYKHQGPKADFVYSRYALHHLPDFWKTIALKRIRQILHTDGILRLWDVIYNFEPIEAEDQLEKWCSTRGKKIKDEWNRADIEEHIRDEYSTFTWLIEPMIERTNFIIEEAEYSPDGFFAKYIARAI